MLTKNLLVINRYFHCYVRKVMEEYHLYGVDPVILSFLRDHEPVNQDSVCTALLADKATAAKSAARLEEMGYIHREVNDRNKREKLLGLTDAGREMVGRLDAAKAHWESICLQGFSEEERALFARLTERAAQNAVELRKKKEEL